MLPVIWLVVSVVFLLIHLVPGDPIQAMLGEGAAGADIQAARHAYGLDVPLGTSVPPLLERVLHGDLGRSLRLNKPVPRSGRPGLSRHPCADPCRALCSPSCSPFLPACARPPAAIAGTTAPSALSVCSACRSPTSPSDPSSFCSLPFTSTGSRLRCRKLAQPRPSRRHHGRLARRHPHPHGAHQHVGGARPGLHPHRPRQGLSERAVVYRHALRNALIPVVTVIGLQFGALLAGAIVTETIFAWPGIGRLTISAISNRDYALVQGCLLCIGLTYVAVNFLTDLVYSALNPRIRQ